MQGCCEHNYLINTSSSRVITKSVCGYADGWGGGSNMPKKFKCGSMFAYTLIAFKKKWKPVLQETLSSKGNSCSNEQNGTDV